MGTSSYVTKLKAQLDRAIIQREHWKQLAENRNSIVVTEVCPESRSVEEYIIDADSVRSAWRLIRGHRERIEALRLQNAMFATAAANINREREALHAEAEALRAENGRLSANIARLTSNPADHRYWEGRYRDAEAELEAARGLLERASSILGSQGYGAWDSLAAEIDALLTATSAPEVPDHIEQHLKMVEQGERQEAVVYAVHAKGAQVDHHCPLVPPEMAADYLDGCATPLYTTPQPGPDVRGLVEALEHARLFIRNGVELGYVKMPDSDTPDPAHETLPKIEAALAAHRQAQRQA